eukprot:29639-Pelagococcus_subviridis.AAC.7
MSAGEANYITIIDNFAEVDDDDEDEHPESPLFVNEVPGRCCGHRAEEVPLVPSRRHVSSGTQRLVHSGRVHERGRFGERSDPGSSSHGRSRESKLGAVYRASAISRLADSPEIDPGCARRHVFLKGAAFRVRARAAQATFAANLIVRLVRLAS